MLLGRYKVVEDPNHLAWLQILSDQRRKGQDTMRILAN